MGPWPSLSRRSCPGSASSSVRPQPVLAGAASCRTSWRPRGSRSRELRSLRMARSHRLRPTRSTPRAHSSPVTSRPERGVAPHRLRMDHFGVRFLREGEARKPLGAIRSTNPQKARIPSARVSGPILSLAVLTVSTSAATMAKLEGPAWNTVERDLPPRIPREGQTGIRNPRRRAAPARSLRLGPSSGWAWQAPSRTCWRKPTAVYTQLLNRRDYGWFRILGSRNRGRGPQRRDTADLRIRSLRDLPQSASEF